MNSFFRFRLILGRIFLFSI